MDDIKGSTIESAIEFDPRELDRDPDLRQIDEGGKYDPTYDKRDMRRLGRKQEMKRRFRFFSIVGYMVILGATWEAVLVTSIFALNNGGKGGAIWITFGSCLGQLTSTLSMAEMASISPTAGGQYHWVSEFGAPGYQKPLSYAVGWLCALGWQTAMPAVSYSAAFQVISLIALCEPGYKAEGWHYALLTMAFVSFAILFNTFAINKLPLIESIVVIVHLCGFFAFVVIFWVMGPRAPPSETFFSFSDENGWGSAGLASLVSLVGPASSLIGADAAVHLAEELKDAAYILPRAMVASASVNYITIFIMVVSLISAIGPDLKAILETPFYQPWVAVIRQITNSRATTIGLVCLIIFLITFTAINQLTTSSRQLWAFSRDKGVPFHRMLSKVHLKDGVPHNAVVVTLCSTVVLACIVIGSTTAYQNILSICNVALVISYIVCIATLVAKRLRGEKLPPGRFDLGRFGLPINCIALGWLSLLALFLFFPALPNPTPAEMNWACFMFGVVVLFAMGYYWVKGRHEYDGPVEYIRKDIYS